ncbi:hypothetical protein Tco_1537349, partial [Tanacetum coccineum]
LSLFFKIRGLIKLVYLSKSCSEDEIREMMYGMGDLTGVSMSLGGEIFSGGKKCQKSNIGDSDNTRDRGEIVSGAIGASGGIGNSLSVASCACMTFDTPRQGENTRRNIMDIITTQWCQQ